MFRRAIRHALISAALLGPRLFAADPIQLVNSNPVKICAECGNTLAVQFVVNAPKVDRNAKLKVVDVEVDGTHDGALLNAVGTPTWQPPGDAIAAIKIPILNAAAFHRQGTYTIYLLVTPVTGDTFYLKPQLTHSAVTLDAPGTITIEHIFGRTGWYDEAPQIPLSPKPFDAGLSDISIHATKAPSGPNGSSIPGTVTFTPPANRSVPPHGSRGATVKLAGAFPFGKSSGPAEVVAPQLANPVGFTYEVNTHLHPGFIFPTAMLGVMLGLSIRVVLQGRIDRLKARIAANELLGRVQTDLSAKRDADFHKALAAPVTALTNSLRSNDTAAITKATTDLDTAWRAQLQTLAASITTESAEVEKLAALVGASWASLPTKVQRVLQTVPIAALREDIANSDAANAITGVADAWQELGSHLRGPRSDWRQDFQDQANLLSGTGAPGISKPNQQAYQQRVQAVTGQWAAFKTPLKDDIPGFLRDANDEGEDARELLRGLQLTIQNEFAVNRKKFASPSDPASLDALGAATEAFCEQLGDSYRDPAQFPKLTDLDALQQAWKTAVVNNAVPANRAAAEAQVSQGQFSVAVDTAVAPAAPKLPASPAPGLTPALPMRARGPAVSTQVLLTAVRFPDPDPVQVEVARNKSELFLDQVWLSLGVALIYSIIAFITYGPKYVGDPFESCGILLWGFGLDFTLDAAVKAIPKK